MGIYQKQRELGNTKPILNWLYLGMAMIFIMVLIGGITRLTDSGLSMVDWKPIMGSLPPLNKQQWADAFEQYKNSPQFKEHNYHFELANFKSIFWWEYIHRLWGRIIGLVFILPFLWFLVRKKLSKPLIARLVVVLLLGSFQGFMGWYMVKSGLVDVPRVSHFRLAAHLLTAFLSISYIYWISLELAHERGNRYTGLTNFKRWNIALLVLVVLQITYGAFVAGKDAGLMHNTWPKMDGYFIHPAATALDSLWESATYNSSMIQFIHRSLAIVLFVFVLSLVWEAAKRKIGGALRSTYKIMGFVVLIQFLLGVFTLLFRVPISLALLHQLGALVLLLSTLRALYLNYKV
ncbi:heme A synthase [bacterium]|nr:heme A synthase [bacterium]